MAMDVREYMQFRCSQMLAMEQDILQMLKQMTGEVQNSQLKQMFQQHQQPTQQQINNLEQVLNQLGGQHEQSQSFMVRMKERLGMEAQGKAPVTQAMMQAHQDFMSMDPPQYLIDLHDAMEGEKVEHMEIAEYRGLIGLARELGEDNIAQLLQQNLSGEQQARAMIEDSLPTLLPQLVRAEMATVRR